MLFLNRVAVLSKLHWLLRALPPVSFLQIRCYWTLVDCETIFLLSCFLSFYRLLMSRWKRLQVLTDAAFSYHKLNARGGVQGTGAILVVGQIQLELNQGKLFASKGRERKRSTTILFALGTPQASLAHLTKKNWALNLVIKMMFFKYLTSNQKVTFREQNDFPDLPMQVRQAVK